MSHVSPYIDNPWQGVQTVIDGSKDKVERIHAGFGVLDYAAVTFIPHEHPAFGAAAKANEGKSEEQLVKELEECCKQPRASGATAAAFPWETVVPLVFALLKKLFPTWF